LTNFAKSAGNAVIGAVGVRTVAGKPMARPMPMAAQGKTPPPASACEHNFLGIAYIADDIDAELPEEALLNFGVLGIDCCSIRMSSFGGI
jgi:hypothetical protein